MGSALQRISVWQWCGHLFAQKRPIATRHRIANNMSLMLASKHAHAIGAISNSIHMLTALHRARAMGICQWSTSRTRLPFSRWPGSPGNWKPSSAPNQLSFAITLGTHIGWGQTVSKTHMLRTYDGQQPRLLPLTIVISVDVRCSRFLTSWLDRKSANKHSKYASDMYPYSLYIFSSITWRWCLRRRLWRWPGHPSCREPSFLRMRKMWVKSE